MDKLLDKLISTARNLERGCSCDYDYRCGRCDTILQVLKIIEDIDRAPKPHLVDDADGLAVEMYNATVRPKRVSDFIKGDLVEFDDIEDEWHGRRGKVVGTSAKGWDLLIEFEDDIGKIETIAPELLCKVRW